jgi:hypothetical protein
MKALMALRVSLAAGVGWCGRTRAAGRPASLSASRARAERRLGLMLAEQKRTVGMNTGARGIGTSAVPTENRTPTLADVGIDKKTFLPDRRKSAASASRLSRL